MAIGTTITLGLGNGTLAGSIPKLVLTGLSPGEAAARATTEDGAWYPVQLSTHGKG
jgi:hypothetical protein